MEVVRFLRLPRAIEAVICVHPRSFWRLRAGIAAENRNPCRD